MFLLLLPTPRLSFLPTLRSDGPHTFPSSPLPPGIKVTMEPPQGVRANLTRTYSELPPSFLAAEGQSPPLAKAWRGLVFSAALFHALVQVISGFGIWWPQCLVDWAPGSGM